MRRAALALTALALAGCSDGGPARPAGPSPGAGAADARPPSDADRIARVLARRAERLERGDVPAARDVPISDAGYAIDDLRIDGRRARIETTASYRLRGIAGRFSSARTLRAVRRGGRWRITAEGGARDRFPWEVEPYAATRSGHFLILAPRGLALGDLPAVLEQAYDDVRERIVRPNPRRRYAVVLARDAAAARRLTAYIQGVDRLAAITDAKVRDEGPEKRVAEVVSLRLLGVQSSLAALGYDGRLRVLTHELTHAVLTRTTSGRTPAWLNEGIALFVSGDRRVAQAADRITFAATRAERRALTLTALSDPDAIARLSGDAQSAAYAYASSAAHYLAARFGEKRLLELYSSFNDPELPGDGGAETVDAALRETLGRSLPALERDLRRWIVTRAVVEPFAP